ncbi:MAG: ATP-binding protein, partial [Stellaceae bacterium]
AGGCRAARRLLGNAMGATERGARLTQQLLSFARRQALRPRSSDAGQVIAGFEAVLRRALGEGVNLELSLDPGLDRSVIDVSQFEAALLNLAVNAHDAMPSGGTLRIAAENARIEAAAAEAVAVAPGRYVRVSVTDSGIGMSSETQSRAFEPFFTTKPVGEGSGLGLSQVYGYMRQLGGAAGIESAPGQGTTVILLLPADPAAVADEPERAAASLAKVLVVEDDADVLNLAVETLRGLDYEVVTAGDGPSALAVLKRSDDIDILFSDIVMPRGMSGVELAREASRIRPGLRVLLASGYAMPSLLAGDGPEGGYAFIGKPYRGAELARMLRSLSSG